MVQKKIKKITLGGILSWIFGILFLLSAVGSIFSGEIFSGIVLFVMAGAILPSANKLLKEKQNIELSRGLKITIIIIGLIIIGITSGSSNIETVNNYENNIQPENSKELQDAELNKVFSETNVYRYRNLKGYDLTLDQVNPISYSGIENMMEAYNILIRDNCGIEPPEDYFMILDTGTFLVINAETYKVECDYLNLVDKDTGLDVPQNEMDSFLTKRENEKLTADVEKESYIATMGEKNALSKALSYLRYSAFSYSGLIDQLEYEGYSYEEAKYGADNCGADWKEQAGLKAQSYLDYSAFSRQGLIDQLEYEGFTNEQAEYGANAVGY